MAQLNAEIKEQIQRNIKKKYEHKQASTRELIPVYVVCKQLMKKLVLPHEAEMIHKLNHSKQWIKPIREFPVDIPYEYDGTTRTGYIILRSDIDVFLPLSHDSATLGKLVKTLPCYKRIVEVFVKENEIKEEMKIILDIIHRVMEETQTLEQLFKTYPELVDYVDEKTKNAFLTATTKVKATEVNTTLKAALDELKRI